MRTYDINEFFPETLVFLDFAAVSTSQVYQVLCYGVLCYWVLVVGCRSVVIISNTYNYGVSCFRVLVLKCCTIIIQCCVIWCWVFDVLHYMLSLLPNH